MTSPEDPLDDALRRYFAHQMAGLDPVAPRTPSVRRPSGQRRSELTLALSVGVGLAAALALMQSPGDQTRPRPRAATPTTSLLQGATADGSRLPAAK